VLRDRSYEKAGRTNLSVEFMYNHFITLLSRLSSIDPHPQHLDIIFLRFRRLIHVLIKHAAVSCYQSIVHGVPERSQVEVRQINELLVLDACMKYSVLCVKLILLVTLVIPVFVDAAIAQEHSVGDAAMTKNSMNMHKARHRKGPAW